MEATEISQIRALFDRAEGESDPRRKVAELEEALDLMDESWEDLPPSDQTLMRNLRRSNTRRLLSQLVAMRDVQFDVWFGYLSLLLFRLGPEMDALLKEDDNLRAAYHAFVGRWGPEAAEALERIVAKSRNAP
jgi:hypothetical protein